MNSSSFSRRGFPRVVALAASTIGVAGVCAGLAVGALAHSAVAPVTVTVGSGTTSPIGLHGVVGPGFTIGFTFSANEQSVAFLQPGTYNIQIDDLSNIHDFHLTGTGVDSSTGVPDVGVSQWTVTLQPGIYHFVCDPHAATMSGQLQVLPYGTVTYFPAPAPLPLTTHHKSKNHH